MTRFLTQHSSEFSVVNRDVCNSLESKSTPLNLDADAHLNLFNSTCDDIINSVALLKYKKVFLCGSVVEHCVSSAKG